MAVMLTIIVLSIIVFKYQENMETYDSYVELHIKESTQSRLNGDIISSAVVRSHLEVKGVAITFTDSGPSISASGRYLILDVSLEDEEEELIEFEVSKELYEEVLDDTKIIFYKGFDVKLSSEIRELYIGYE